MEILIPALIVAVIVAAWIQFARESHKQQPDPSAGADPTLAGYHSSLLTAALNAPDGTQAPGSPGGDAAGGGISFDSSAGFGDCDSSSGMSC